MGEQQLHCEKGSNHIQKWLQHFPFIGSMCDCSLSPTLLPELVIVCLTVANPPGYRVRAHHSFDLTFPSWLMMVSIFSMSVDLGMFSLVNIYSGQWWSNCQTFLGFCVLPPAPQNENVCSNTFPHLKELYHLISC